MSSKKFIVEWSGSASNDLGSIIFHIAKGKRYSELGKVPVELERLQIGGFRELVVSPWRIFYRKENNKVVVVAFLVACAVTRNSETRPDVRCVKDKARSLNIHVQQL